MTYMYQLMTNSRNRMGLIDIIVDTQPMNSLTDR